MSLRRATTTRRTPSSLVAARSRRMPLHGVGKRGGGLKHRRVYVQARGTGVGEELRWGRGKARQGAG